MNSRIQFSTLSNAETISNLPFPFNRFLQPNRDPQNHQSHFTNHTLMTITSLIVLNLIELHVLPAEYHTAQNADRAQHTHTHKHTEPVILFNQPNRSHAAVLGRNHGRSAKEIGPKIAIISSQINHPNERERVRDTHRDG